MSLVHGTVAPGYEKVREVFAAEAARPGDVAAQLAVYRHGRPVVDLYTHDGDALTAVFAVTMGAAHLVLALLVQDGLVGVARSVRHYWPQFTSDVTVRELLQHRAGLIGVDGGFGPREVADDRIIAERLAKQRPYWTRGAGYGYHVLVIGALAGEIVRRVTGRSLQQTYEQRVRAPYGVDLYLGLPECLEPRYRPIRPAVVREPPPDPASLAGIALNRHADPPTDLVAFANSRTVRRLGQASAGGVASARGVARLYAAALSGVDGIAPLLHPRTITEFGTAGGPARDLLTGATGNRFGLGFEALTTIYPFLGPAALGHSGAAGSLGFADPRSGVAYGYTRDRFAPPGGAAENDQLAAAVIQAADG
ncbi:serine hydrolase domain-containing protein [Amorphoplanes digitatis]|uniref:CubicO group peptidase (Beta-lactamase class C family) n=1 Tax=Actinoplanes digitatis TaxID=1868 RepID=A0A7W7MQP0_9ACTN|nr:serine hydrolase domain-containing protein [Actinoplanes digitatis]MBB4763431.1 CubicO group peptidase (beta-lactamase class C family) [Actinoplanes digitatis]GID92250.1 serine hydrolase [Actinoplanes digitatis]